MPDLHGHLGAVAPAATTNTELYACPSGHQATVKVVLCNRGSTDTTFRFAYVPGAIGTVAAKDYWFYDAPLPANSTLDLGNRIALTAGHALMVRFGSADCSAAANGVQEVV